MAMDNHTHKYDDIINLPHPTSSRHPRMSLDDRAAQFSPFAALTGHEAAIQETARLTDRMEEIDEDMAVRLNERIQILQSKLSAEAEVSITYFLPDTKKAGGSYLTHVGVVKKIDTYAHTLLLTDQTVIPIDHIRDIEGNIFRDWELDS